MHPIFSERYVVRVDKAEAILLPLPLFLHSIVSSCADGISAAESAAAVAVVGRAALLPAGALVVARARRPRVPVAVPAGCVK